MSEELEASDLPIIIRFYQGTLDLINFKQELLPLFPLIRYDQRTLTYKAPAYAYRHLVLTLRSIKIAYTDQAIQFSPLTIEPLSALNPRNYQTEAIQKWEANNKLGVISLPTGAGKTYTALLAIIQTKRPTLIHVPTIDLMQQWHSFLSKNLSQPIGLLGGGYYDLQAITVATYDSALIHIGNLGNRYGLIIFDECHHLPSDQYQYLAISSLAPYRLGLSATVERTDGREFLLYQLIGDLCYEKQITELEGSVLAPYVVKTLEVELTEEEQTTYQNERKTYIDYLKKQDISLSESNSWQRFIFQCMKTSEGKRALQAYYTQKRITQTSQAKLQKIWELIKQHYQERMIIFTQDNEMAYHIGNYFYLPVLTHHTKVKEREDFLNQFRSGQYRILVTSKVLNEGVDVPEANIAIIVSGSGSTREHVQRLGRILRASPNKQATLYELVSKNTSERYVNERRREHIAYTRTR